jgi:hypothetical protein
MIGILPPEPTVHSPEHVCFSVRLRLILPENSAFLLWNPRGCHGLRFA